jgi:AraC family transcriptional regulator
MNMNTLSASLYGEVVSTGTIAGLTLTETKYCIDLKLPKHAHIEPYFCFVLKGAYTESYDRRWRSCKTATLVFHPPEEPHADHFHTDARCFNIQMNQAWMERMRQYPVSLNEPKDYPGGVLPRLALRLYDEFRKADELSSLVVEGIALELIGEASRRFAKKTDRVAPRWLAEVRDLLHEQFCEPFTLHQLAHGIGIHPVHLAREFRRFYHRTIGDYVRQLRIEFACEKLRQSDTPLSEIALATGFFDQSHFTRIFKQQTGKTPQQYRSLFRCR